MIRLTIKSNGKPIYIAPENITAICDNKEGGAEVYSGHDFSLVTESPEEVARKVLEWKYIMQKGAYTNTQEMARLRELAGLEDTNHDT